MKKMYVAWDDLWPYIQKEYEKARERNDLNGQHWCNYFEMLICNAEHKTIEVEN